MLMKKKYDKRSRKTKWNPNSHNMHLSARQDWTFWSLKRIYEPVPYWCTKYNSQGGGQNISPKLLDKKRQVEKFTNPFSPSIKEEMKTKEKELSVLAKVFSTIFCESHLDSNVFSKVFLNELYFRVTVCFPICQSFSS